MGDRGGSGAGKTFISKANMKVLVNSDLRLFILLFAAALLVTWMVPAGAVFAQGEEEEELLEEINGEEAEKGSIEVLGFTEEDAGILDNRLLITVIALVVAAVGGLFLSFVIRGRT
jgi:hypothetical protein